MSVGDEGYIKYNDKIVKVKIIEIRFENYKIIQTEDGDILGIPPEADTHIWKTYEDCDYHENYPCLWFVPMGE